MTESKSNPAGSTPSCVLLNRSVPGNEFDWSQFQYASESERIKAYSHKYKDASIVDAFNDVYGLKGKNVLVSDETIESTPREYNIGDVFDVRISSISKNHVVFSGASLKTEMVSNTNLYKWEKFKHYLPTDPIKVKVVDIDKRGGGKVVVDPIIPLIDEWLAPIAKNPRSQQVIGAPKIVKVKDLRIVSGGFTGDAVVPSVSEFIGEDYTVPTFIPGSQIVLNIADDFKSFEGKTVDTFVSSFNYRMTGSKPSISLVCSAKNYLRFLGSLNIIGIFDSWCDDGEEWQKIKDNVYEGTVTGVLNSSRKCGVFVEIPSLFITGMIPTDPASLVNYKPKDKVSVCIKSIEEDMYYNQAAGQFQHNDPYVIEDGVLLKCNIKPVLELVEEA